MCGRFELNISKEQLIKTFVISDPQMPMYEPNFNIPPGTDIPIIYQIGDHRRLTAAHWGLIPSWAKDRSIASHTFNARSETVAEKPSFRSAYKRRRCMIPATGYYEWKTLLNDGKPAGKQPFWIGLKDHQPFAMAGLFENWTDTESGEKIESCTIITRDAFPGINDIHSRMPVILPSEYYQLWLKGAIDDFPMIEEQDLTYYPVSKAVGSPSNNYEFKPLSD
jgi:putative SOS response-associated peptidase YedK